jgi:hypothetical protein
MNSDLGFLSALVILSALILDFFFLPAIVIKIYEKKLFRVKKPVEPVSAFTNLVIRKGQTR